MHKGRKVGLGVSLSLIPVVAMLLLLPTSTLVSERSDTRSTERSAAKTVATSAASGLDKLRHLIFIVQENRSFDNYFGTYPGADGIPMSNGTPTVCIPDPVLGHCVRPFHDTSLVDLGGPHNQQGFLTDFNHGGMNGFVTTDIAAGMYCTSHPHAARCVAKVGPGGVPDVMGYHTAAEIPNYWAYASHYVLQDHMYESVDSWTMPSHLFLVSAWSAVCAGPYQPMSCASSADGSFTQLNRDRLAKPTYAWTDITYLLHRYAVSWRYYIGTGCIDACQSVPGATPALESPLQGFTDVHTDHQLSNIQSHSAYFQDAKAGTLPAVSWVIPGAANSEHPPQSIAPGQAFVTQVVNAAMQSPDWSSTAIFITWDDWGGFYDNVPPLRIGAIGYGFRVPGIMISPWARAGYIDHQALSSDAYLKLIEARFLGGQRLNPATDGRPDSRPVVRESIPALGNLISEFDFNQTPLPPLILPPYPSG
jgi:phospholipase C